MKPLPHRYAVTMSAGADGYGTLSSAGVEDLRTAAPLDFDGPGDAWSPEQLLLAAVQSCFVLTFRAVARASGVSFASIDVDAEGVVDRADGRTRFTGIVLRPRVTLSAPVDPDKLRRVLDKAERACLISASLGAPVRLDLDAVAATVPGGH
jgi:peroxiredoxin-like protein